MKRIRYLAEGLLLFAAAMTVIIIALPILALVVLYLLFSDEDYGYSSHLDPTSTPKPNRGKPETNERAELRFAALYSLQEQLREQIVQLTERAEELTVLGVEIVRGPRVLYLEWMRQQRRTMFEKSLLDRVTHCRREIELLEEQLSLLNKGCDWSSAERLLAELNKGLFDSTERFDEPVIGRQLSKWRFELRVLSIRIHSCSLNQIEPWEMRVDGRQDDSQTA